eukprot:284819148_3
MYLQPSFAPGRKSDSSAQPPARFYHFVASPKQPDRAEKKSTCLPILQLDILIQRIATHFATARITLGSFSHCVNASTDFAFCALLGSRKIASAQRTPDLGHSRALAIIWWAIWRFALAVFPCSQSVAETPAASSSIFTAVSQRSSSFGFLRRAKGRIYPIILRQQQITIGDSGLQALHQAENPPQEHMQVPLLILLWPGSSSSSLDKCLLYRATTQRTADIQPGPSRISSQRQPRQQEKIPDAAGLQSS